MNTIKGGLVSIAALNRKMLVIKHHPRNLHPE